MTFLYCLCACFWVSGAQASERIALVIGNSDYGQIAPLENPAHDAELVAQSLEDVGFRVTRLIDSTQADMMRGISTFGRALREADEDATGLFYFAGHGVQSFGSNYLLPVDIVLQDAADLDLVGVDATAVLRQMHSAGNKTNIVILDACRNNPFSDIPEFNESGLAEMRAPAGTFLSYATEPGGVALDGTDGNSPFTRALARHIGEPGLRLEQLFKEVRVDVRDATNGRQTPWDTSSLTVDFMFVEEDPLSAEDLAARQYWSSVQETRDPVQLMLFLRAYPDSAYDAEARALLQELMAEEIDGDPSPAAVSEGPSETEQAAFAAAQEKGSITAYEVFLEAFPNGTFSELVEDEIASLREGSSLDPDGEGVTPETDEPPAAPTMVPDSDVTFLDPLEAGDEAIVGRSISELITSSPLYPPVEGLPEEYWKEQTCSNCHDWRRENLCDQASVYLAENTERSLTKDHPFGGTFKVNLRNWAANDCQ